MVSAILRNAIQNGLLVNSYAEEGRATYEQIRGMLNREDTGRQPAAWLSHHVCLALTTLGILLGDQPRAVRLSAREICESLDLPLDLPQMLDLSIAGVKSEDAKQVDNLVLVIGITGSGKSTLINYLSGIDYEFKEDPTTGDMFLLPKEGQPVPPAKVGHSGKSQTLYPQIIQASNYAFCDSPGFDDTRRGEKAVCAALGVPLAVEYSKKIAGIIVCIDYKTTENGAGRSGPFRLLNQTLSNLINLPKPDCRKNFPLFFAITRPPERKATFKTALLHKQTLNRIAGLYREAVTASKLLPEKEKRLAKVQDDYEILSTSLRELENLKQTEFALGKSGVMSGALAWLFGGSGLVQHDRIQHKLEELKAGWQGLPPKAVEDLVQVLRTAFESQVQKKETVTFFLSEIGKQIEVWKKDREVLKEQIQSLQQEIEQIRGEEAILGLMHENGGNVFIIRGFKDSPKDDDDHKQGLYEAISGRLSGIAKSQFVFDPNNRAFDGVKRWIDSFIAQIGPKLTYIKDISELAERLRTDIEEKRRLIDGTRIEIGMEIKGDQADHDAQVAQLRARIEDMKQQRSKKHGLRDYLYQAVAVNESEIDKIQNAREVDYRSEFRREERLWVGRALKLCWSYTYSFQHKDNSLFQQTIEDLIGRADLPETIIPIERVELSTIVADKKVMFKTPLDNAGILPDPNFAYSTFSDEKLELRSSAIYGQRVQHVEKKSGGRECGALKPTRVDLDRGIFKVKYHSNDGEAGYFGIRCFVLPRNLPREKDQVNRCRAANEETRKEITKTTADITRLTADIASDEGYLELLKTGMKNQEIKIQRIRDLLFRLGASSEQELVRLLGLKEENSLLVSLAWLEPLNFNKVRELLLFKGENFPDSHLKIDLRNFLVVMGLNFTVRFKVFEEKKETDAERAELKAGEVLIYREKEKRRIVYRPHHLPKSEKEPLKEKESKDPHRQYVLDLINNKPEDLTDSNGILRTAIYNILQARLVSSPGPIWDLASQEAGDRLRRISKALPHDFFVNMLYVAEKTGFTIASIHEILTGLAQGQLGGQIQSLRRQEREKEQTEFWLNKLWSLYEGHKLRISCVHELIKLFRFRDDNVAVQGFLQCHESVKILSSKELKHDPLPEEIEESIIAHADLFKRKFKFSEAEWNQVVRDFKNPVKQTSWEGLWTDGSRIGLRFSSDLPPEVFLILGVTPATAVSLLQSRAAEESVRSSLAGDISAAFFSGKLVDVNDKLPALQKRKQDLCESVLNLEVEAQNLMSDIKYTYQTLHHCVSPTFLSTFKGHTQEAEVMALAGKINKYFSELKDFEENVGRLIGTEEVYVSYCKQLPINTVLGLATINLINTLRGANVVIWELTPNSPTLFFRVSSVPTTMSSGPPPIPTHWLWMASKNKFALLHERRITVVDPPPYSA